MYQLFKNFAKKLPGIRRVVEGRDRYIQLYTEQELLNRQLQRELDDCTAHCQRLDTALRDKETICSEFREVNRSLTAQNQTCMGKISALEEEKQTLTQENTSQKEELAALAQKSAQLERALEEAKAQLQATNYAQRSSELSSANFWNEHYANGGNSGTGSYNRLAAFKAEIVNQALQDYSIQTAVEIGCGDGNQLSLISYPSYTGVDVSPVIVEKNREKFASHENRVFYCSLTDREKYINNRFDLGVSMDVIFHLLEDDVFHAYLNDLFTLATRYVIIYSSNHEEYTPWPEYRHRNFTGYVSENFPHWELIRYIPNRYPYKPGSEEDTSSADFYIYKNTRG